jgi:(2Fe-2S) ferredoxin
MAKLRNVEELDRLRDTKQRSMQVEAATGTIITVGMGTCGIAAGAKDTLDAIRQELLRLKVSARVGITGCIGICVKEPLVDIQQAGGPRITYANVSPEMVPRLIEEQLIHGRPIKEWVVGRLTTE